MSTAAWLLLALVVALLFGLGLVVKALLWVAIIAAVVYVGMYFMHGAKRSVRA